MKKNYFLFTNSSKCEFINMNLPLKKGISLNRQTLKKKITWI